MSSLVSRYIHVITQETKALMADDDKLSPKQWLIIRSIHQNTDQLLIATEKVGETGYNEVIRYKLLDLLTPISGYVEMIVDGWIGDLNSRQVDRINLISAAVQRLTNYVRSYPIEFRETTFLS